MAAKKMAKSKKAATTKIVAKNPKTKRAKAKFPRHPVGKAIRIAGAIFDQNAGKECSRKQAAKFFGLSSPIGPFSVEISSANKYGLLENLAQASSSLPN